MTVKQLVTMAAAYAGITLSELARRIDWSPQLLDKRLRVGKLTMEEWQLIGRALGAEAVITFRFPDGKDI